MFQGLVLRGKSSCSVECFLGLELTVSPGSVEYFLGLELTVSPGSVGVFS